MAGRSAPEGCAGRAVGSRSKALIGALAALVTHPFADAEIIAQNAKYMQFEFSGFFDAAQSLGHRRAFHIEEAQPEYLR
eukprot:scaffold162127_cov19-Prasinocladus_malaysianus.AAC.2